MYQAPGPQVQVQILVLPTHVRVVRHKDYVASDLRREDACRADSHREVHELL
jgi:hypothetical protein